MNVIIKILLQLTEMNVIVTDNHTQSWITETELVSITLIPISFICSQNSAYWS